MKKNQNVVVRILLTLGVYLVIKHFVPQGKSILYPINLFVTYLHEFGHAIGAVITGGKVASLEVNQDSSGVTYTLGGNRAIILMGGYIGSAIFGNILLYVGAKMPKLSKYALYILSAAMIFSTIFWYADSYSAGLLVVFSIVLSFIAWKTPFAKDVLMFLGLASIIHIIEDFNVGPSSDLEQYAKIFQVVPSNVWMYVWLVIVVILFAVNIRWILRR